MKETDKKGYKEIRVGELTNNGGNSEVLKNLFWVIPNSKPSTDIQTLIDECDTKIKHPRFLE